MICRRLLISGRVQGVGYRAWFAGRARTSGLAGWVRNLTDGRVEAVIEGSTEAVDTMIASARRGPSASRVDEVEVGGNASRETLVGFETRATV